MEVRKGYKQTEVGIIPEDWEVAPVGEAYEICNNLRLPISRTVRKQMEGQYPYYGPTSIQGYINEYRVEGEYALIGEDGDHFLKWQEQSMTLLIHGRFNVNNHAHLIKGTKNLTAWFYYYFSHLDITPYLTRQGAGRYKLNKRTLMGIPCVLPPTLAEQEAIAEALSDADALIEAVEQLLAKKRQVKQGAMSELLTGKRRLAGFGKNKYKQTEIGVVPEDWRVENIGQISIVGRGRVISHKEIAKSRTPLYPVYSSQTSDNGVMGYIDTFDFDGEYVTWTTDGANAGTVFHRNGKFNCTNVCGTIKLKSDNHLFVAKVLGGFASKYVSRHLGNPKIMNDVMKHVNIPLPSTLAEQTAIAEILSDMDAEISALEGKLVKARQVKAGMMSELLTGKIRLVESGSGK